MAVFFGRARFPEIDGKHLSIFRQKDDRRHTGLAYKFARFCLAAWFAARKRPPTAQLPDVTTEELRELARLRGRLQEDFASRLRQLHRAVDLGFPEFTGHVRTLESQLATAILSRYPTAASFRGASVRKLARIVYDGSHKIGEELARTLVEVADKSVGSHHSEPGTLAFIPRSSQAFLQAPRGHRGHRLSV